MRGLANDYWAKSGVPTLHKSKLPRLDGEHPEWCKAFRWAREVVGRLGIIALIGDRGTGKTQIAVELIRILTLIDEPPRPAMYIRAADMFSAIRDNMRATNPNEREAVRAFTRPHLLCVDEAHEMSASDFEQRKMNLILDTRYGEGLPSMFCANVIGDTAEEQAESFRRLIGETIFDRISETGGVLPCNWKSFRVKGE